MDEQVIAISNHPLPQNEGELQLCISDADFVRQVVEELIEKIPLESASSAQEPESRNVALHIEHSPVEQHPEDTSKRFLDTDTDITEYESAADTEPSDPLVSTGSLFTLSDCRAGDTFSSCSTPDECVKGHVDTPSDDPTSYIVTSECNKSFGIGDLCQGLNNLALDTPKRRIFCENQFSVSDNERTDFTSQSSIVPVLEKVKNVLPEDNVQQQVSVGNVVDDISFSTSSNTDSFVGDNVVVAADKPFTKEAVECSTPCGHSCTILSPNTSYIIPENSISGGSVSGACTEFSDLTVCKACIIVNEEPGTHNCSDFNISGGKESESEGIRITNQNQKESDGCGFHSIVAKQSDTDCSEIKLENTTARKLETSAVDSQSYIVLRNVEADTGTNKSEKTEDEGKDLDIISNSTNFSVCENSFVLDKEPTLPPHQEEFYDLAAEASKIAEVIHNAFDENLDELCIDEIQAKMSSEADVNSDVLESGSPKMKPSQDSETGGGQYVINHDLKGSDNTQLTSCVLEEDCLEKTSTPRKRNTCRTPIKKMNGNEMSPKPSDELKPKGSDASHETCDKSAENSDVFKDPTSFDFLSSVGNVKSARDLRNESLYVKFDPLVGADSPVNAAVSRLDSEDSVALEGSTVDEYSSTVNSRDQTKNHALDFLDQLISFTPIAESGKPHFTANDSSHLDHTLEKERSLIKKPEEFIHDSNRSKLHNEKAEADHAAPEELQHLRDLVLQQEQFHKEEVKKYRTKVRNLEDRIQFLTQKLAQNTQGEQEMSLILEEYEKTISRLVAEKEHERQAFDSEKETIMREKDTISCHLANIEIAFSDVHQKYERSKQVIQGFKNNEEALRASVNEYEASLKKQEQKYEILKMHAMTQLESANQELVAMRKNHEAENSKLTAMLKKAEIKIHSLEESLEQKTKENQELVNICDELIGKVGNCD